MEGTPSSVTVYEPSNEVSRAGQIRHSRGRRTMVDPFRAANDQRRASEIKLRRGVGNCRQRKAGVARVTPRFRILKLIPFPPSTNGLVLYERTRILNREAWHDLAKSGFCAPACRTADGGGFKGVWKNKCRRIAGPAGIEQKRTDGRGGRMRAATCSYILAESHSLVSRCRVYQMGQDRSRLVSTPGHALT